MIASTKGNHRMRTRYAFLTALFGRLVLNGLIVLGFAADPVVLGAQQRDEVKTPAASSGTIADPFQRLRRTVTTPRPDYWHRVSEALQKLETLEGAAYNSRYGVVTLHGKPAEDRGPFHLDDLMVALRAAYFETDSVGMTIDPLPDNPRGPEMQVVFFGGCENTALGWVIFECDRLMKSLSQGEDNLTHQPVRPDGLDDFLNMLELSRGFGEHTSNEWNRFWLSTDLKQGDSWRKKPTKSNGTQPVLLVTADGAAMSFLHCRLYVRTQVMALRGGKMIPVAEGKSKAAEQFAIRFVNHYDELAEQYPVFARAVAFARLVVLCEWLDWLSETSGLLLDTQFIRNYRQQVPVMTPIRTSARKSSMKWDERRSNGYTSHELQIYGGVDLEPRAFIARDQDGAAQKQRELSDRGLESHPQEITWMDRSEGSPRRVVVFPTARTQLQPTPEAPRDGIELRESQQADPQAKSPDSHLPPTPRIAESDRIEDVPIVPVTLTKIDERSSQSIRGPPNDKEQALLVDLDYFTRSDRIEVVDRVSPSGTREGSRKDARGPPSHPSPPPGGKPDPDVSPRPRSERRSTNERTTAGSSFAGSDRSELIHRFTETPEKREVGHYSQIEARRLPIPSDAPEKRLATDAASGSKTEDIPSATPLGLSIFTTPEGIRTYNFPRLHEPSSPRYHHEVGIAGRPDTNIEVIRDLAVMSECGDIMVDFAQPQIDQVRGRLFYPPSTPGESQLAGYYPDRRTLEFQDGMRIAFDKDGNPHKVRLPNATSLTFRYATQLKDGSNWPRPVACEVTSKDNRAVSGTYRLVADAGNATNEVRASPSPDATTAEPQNPIRPTDQAEPERIQTTKPREQEAEAAEQDVPAALATKEETAFEKSVPVEGEDQTVLFHPSPQDLTVLAIPTLAKA